MTRLGQPRSFPAALIAATVIAAAVGASIQVSSKEPAPRVLRLPVPVPTGPLCPFWGPYVLTSESTFSMSLTNRSPCASLAYSGPENLTFVWVATVGSVTLDAWNSECATTGVCLDIVGIGPFYNETGSSGTFTFQGASGWIWIFQAYSNWTTGAAPSPSQIVWIR